MKQFWLGLGLIGLILISGLFLGRQLEETFHPQAKDLEKAAACAAEGDWDLASALVTRAKKDWEKNRNLTAAFVHHDPISDIDTRFASLSVHLTIKNTPEFRDGCVSLARILRSLPQPHGLHWWNLL